MSYLIVNIIYRTLLAYLSFCMWVLFSVDPASYLLPLLTLAIIRKTLKSLKLKIFSLTYV